MSSNRRLPTRTRESRNSRQRSTSRIVRRRKRSRTPSGVSGIVCSSSKRNAPRPNLTSPCHSIRKLMVPLHSFYFSGKKEKQMLTLVPSNQQSLQKILESCTLYLVACHFCLIHRPTHSSLEATTIRHYRLLRRQWRRISAMRQGSV